MKLKSLALYGLSLALIGLSLFLAFRLMSPQYQREELKSLNTLGTFHTQLAAESLNTQLSKLRTEMKDNALRLVDPSRGSFNLDFSKWLWIRVQDQDRRAPNFLDPLPAPRADVDSWTLSSAKNQVVLSERVPFMRDGVQDFVLIEGGIKSVALLDLQKDDRFGFWVFDLKSYKQGGLSKAKVVENSSREGSLGKEELTQLTSDLLGQLIKSESVVNLNAPDTDWSLFFKKAGDESQFGIMGYWSTHIAPQDVSSTWLSLAAALAAFALLSTFVIQKFFLNKEEPAQEFAAAKETVNKSVEPAVSLEHNLSPIENVNVPKITKEKFLNIAETSHSPFNLEQFARGLGEKLKNPFSSIYGHLELASDSLKGSDNESANSSQIERVIGFIDTARLEAKRCNQIVDRLISFTKEENLHKELFDFEIFWKDFTRSAMESHIEIPPSEMFFDSNLWKIYADVSDVKLLMLCYMNYLYSSSLDANSLVKISVRHIENTAEDTNNLKGWVDITTSAHTATALRIIFTAPTLEQIDEQNILKSFEFFSGATAVGSDVELPLSLKVVKRLGASLRMKSSVQEGNVLMLDIPAAEARRPEDVLYIKQTKEMPEDVTRLSLSNISASFDDQLDEESDSRNKASQKNVRLAQIEKVNSFAEDLSDDRTRARSRFKIRRPGERD